ncbi:MAG: germination protein YpeB [Clostridia bacterium]|nr:germination protein YpeB [Clostridia bacterium]
MSEKKVSSGADKAENLTRKKSASQNNKAQSTAVKSTAKAPQKSKTATESKPKAQRKEPTKAELKEDRKLEAAKIKAEKKEKRQQRRLEHKQRNSDKIAAMKNKRLERKEKRLERKEKRLERRDQLKNETRAMRAERKKQERLARVEETKARRAARLEAKNAKREHRLKLKEQRLKRRENKQRTPGFGGWLAAVIALGVTTLALGTMLTFGWMGYNGIQADVTADATHSLYELNAIVDNIDANLSKARVSSSAGEQAMILSDITIESELAESCLENLPVAGNLTQNMTSFINKMGESAQSMLYSVASGNQLTDSQIATIEYMYNTNMQVKEILNELTSNCCEKDMLKAITSHKGIMFDSFDKITNISVETPKEIYDGPFAEQTEKVSAKNLYGMEEITPSEAENLARKYFADYDIKGVQCTGETTAKQLSVYNISIDTDDGEYFAQISRMGGKVVMFDSFKECHDNNFDVDNCITIAENMLDSLGYNDMQPVWVSESGTTCNLNFAYVQDGTVIYPDIIKVKVCEERGKVIGIEAISYVLNHIERDIPTAAISKETASEKINANIEVKGSRLALIPKNGEEVLAYEFYGTYGGNAYYIYIDANTGAELEVFTVVGTAQGKALL